MTQDPAASPPPPGWQAPPPGWQAPPPPWQPPPGGQAAPPPAKPRVGLLVGLVLVLVAMCGGLALTSWRILGTDDAATATAAGGPSVRPTVRASDAAGSGTVGSGVGSGAAGSGTPSPVAPAPTASASAASASAAPAVPAGSAPQPIGISHVVTWPDHLQAVVYRAVRNDLPAAQSADHPSDVAVLVSVLILNNTQADVTINQDKMRLWYGDDRQPADEFVSGGMGGGVNNTIRSGSKGYGQFAFAVPPQDLTKLEIELVPRPGDVPARWAGSAD